MSIALSKYASSHMHKMLSLFRKFIGIILVPRPLSSHPRPISLIEYELNRANEERKKKSSLFLIPLSYKGAIWDSTLVLPCYTFGMKGDRAKGKGEIDCRHY